MIVSCLSFMLNLQELLQLYYSIVIARMLTNFAVYAASVPSYFTVHLVKGKIREN